MGITVDRWPLDFNSQRLFCSCIIYFCWRGVCTIRSVDWKANLESPIPHFKMKVLRKRNKRHKKLRMLGEMIKMIMDRRWRRKINQRMPSMMTRTQNTTVISPNKDKNNRNNNSKIPKIWMLMSKAPQMVHLRAGERVVKDRKKAADTLIMKQLRTRRVIKVKTA